MFMFPQFSPLHCFMSILLSAPQGICVQQESHSHNVVWTKFQCCCLILEVCVSLLRLKQIEDLLNTSSPHSTSAAMNFGVGDVCCAQFSLDERQREWMRPHQIFKHTPYTLLLSLSVIVSNVLIVVRVACLFANFYVDGIVVKYFPHARVTMKFSLWTTVMLSGWRVLRCCHCTNPCLRYIIWCYRQPH